MQWSNIAGNIFQELHLKYLIHPESAREGFSTEAAHDQPQGAEADAVHGFLLRSTDVVDSVGGNIITELLKLVDHLFQHRVILHLNALHRVLVGWDGSRHHVCLIKYEFVLVLHFLAARHHGLPGKVVLYLKQY